MSLFSMFSNDLGVDLGTSNVLIYADGKGLVVREPSVVAVDKNTGKILQVGAAARNMLGRTPGNVVAMHPLKDGIVSDHEMTVKMLQEMFKTATKAGLFTPKPRVVVSVPSGVSEVEERSVINAAIEAGARRVFLIEEPLAAGLGAGLDIRGASGHMVVDIGGGTTDIAVLSLGGKVKATSVRVAGNHYDDEILKHVRNKFSIAIGQRTAEQLKKNVACCPQKADFNETMEVKGRSLLTGLPIRVNVSTSDLYEPVMMLSEQIGTAAHQVLEKTPPELAGDIFRNGVVLTGGGAQLHGLPEYLSQELKVNVEVSPDPVNCVALGTAMSLSVRDRLETGFTDATPRIGRR